MYWMVHHMLQCSRDAVTHFLGVSSLNSGRPQGRLFLDLIPAANHCGSRLCRRLLLMERVLFRDAAAHDARLNQPTRSCSPLFPPPSLSTPSMSCRAPSPGDFPQERPSRGLQWGDQAGGGAGGGFTSSSPLCPTAAWTAGESLVGPPATWTVGKANLMPLFSKADLISA
jgi:hypothetical protein